MRLERLTGRHLPLIEPWFGDPETRRRLGGPRWPGMILRLTERDPGRRHAWVALDGAEPVALLDVELLHPRIAAAAIVVAPARRGQGVARQACERAACLPELAGVSVEAHVEHDNHASLRLSAALGLAAQGTPDSDGFVRLTRTAGERCPAVPLPNHPSLPA